MSSLTSGTKTVKINNFNLGLFTNLLEESLKVTPQLMLEFKDNMIKSCSFSSTKTLIKLWTIPINHLISQPESIDLDVVLPKETIKLENDFNFYVLKGDIFLKYLSVFDKKSVNIEILLDLIDDKYQAKTIKIFGKSSVGNSVLQTKFDLTTEEFLTNKISDYAEILTACTPSQDMFEFSLKPKNVTEIKSLIKNLHKSAVDNTAFLTFKITKDLILISDKVFTVNFDVDITTQTKNAMNNWRDDEVLEFQILKSNFLLIGEHDFTLFTNSDAPKVIFGSRYLDSILWCMIVKHDTSIKSIDDAESYAEIDELNLDDYLIDID